MKRLIHSVLNMKSAAWAMLSWSCRLAALMVFVGCVILFEAGPADFDNFRLYRLAQLLGEAPAGVLLLGTLGTLILQFEK